MFLDNWKVICFFFFSLTTSGIIDIGLIGSLESVSGGFEFIGNGNFAGLILSMETVVGFPLISRVMVSLYLCTILYGP